MILTKVLGYYYAIYMRSPTQMNLMKLQVLLDVQWTFCFGLWTITNLIRFKMMQRAAQGACTILFSLNTINYLVCLICGVLPAMTLLSFGVVVLIFGPILLYNYFR